MGANRRGAVIVMVVALVAAGAGLHLAAAQDVELDVKITEINSDGEYIVIENTGNRPYDLSGMTVAFDDNQDRYSLPDGVVLDPGESITVGTGSETTTNTDHNAGYSGPVLNNNEPDIVTLKQNGDTVIRQIEQNADGDGDSGDEVTDGGSEDTTEETTTSDDTTEETTTSDDTTEETTTSDDTTTTDGDTGDSGNSTDSNDSTSDDSGQSDDPNQSDDTTDSDDSESSEDKDC